MRYERMRLLGRGATAETWLVRDLQRGGHPVAQKLFFPEWAQERPDLIDREFHTLAGLVHPYIAVIEDFGEEDGRLYLASQFVEGRPLLDAVRDWDRHKIVWIFFQVLEALDYLHFRNVVHLDLKPENVLVRESPSGGLGVKLIDFGLSAAGAGKAGEAIGTPPFTAPEFALRRGTDTRSDLYSVGVLFYAALSGRLPFEADDPVALLNRQLQEDPEPLKDFAPQAGLGLSDFVQRLLHRDPKRRWETPRAALEGLKAALGEGERVTARVAPAPLFEDAGLLFREKEARDLLEGILEAAGGHGGRWLVRGGAGMGKTFLSRWLERELWSRQKKVLSLHGGRIVLEAPEISRLASETAILVDDADSGPVEAWLEALPFHAAAVLFAGGDSSLAAEEGRVIELGPLEKGAVERILKKALPGLEPESPLARDWSAKAAGSPRELVRHGRDLAARGAVVWGGFWKIGKGAPAGEIEDPTGRLLSFLDASRVSLDAETLAVWTGWSVAEVEEAIAEAVRAGVLERFFSGGGIFYRFSGRFGGRKDETGPPPADPARFFRKLHDEGRYEEGLRVFETYFGETYLPSDLTLARARLLAGAGRYGEAVSLLTPDFITGLLEKEPRRAALAFETLGKSDLFAGRSEEGRRNLVRAVELAFAEKDNDTLSRALLHLGILSQRMGDFRGAEGFYEQSLQAAQGTEETLKDLLAGAALLNLANLYFDAAQWDAAETAYRKCLDRLKKTRHGAVTAQAHLNLANLSFYQGKLLQAEEEAREALRLAVPQRFLLSQGRALLLLAMVDGARGRSDRQGERLSEALFALEEAGQAFEQAVALIHRAYFREARGTLSEAEADARWAADLARRSSAGDLEVQAGLILGKILAHDPKNDEEAWGFLEKACRHFSHGRNLQMSWECEFECGEFLKARQCPTEARACFARALDAVDALALKLAPGAREAFLRDGKRDKIKERLL